MPILISFLPLGMMVFSDFRERRINGYVFMLFMGTAFFSAWLYFDEAVLLWNLRVNVVFLSLLYLFLAAFAGILRRRIFSLTGRGDLLFLPALVPFFGPREFVCFLTGAFLFSLGVYGLSGIFHPCKPMQTVPLVGTTGIFFMIYIPFMLWTTH